MTTETLASQGLTGSYYEAWQDEAWTFYESLGEFNYGVSWLSDALSRCRLNVAELTPGGDEPKIITSGPAVDILEQLAGGTDGQAAMLRSFAVQLSVAGEAYLVGHQTSGLGYEPYQGVILDARPDASGNVWTVQPITTVKRSGNAVKRVINNVMRRSDTQSLWKMQVNDVEWVDLPPESLVVRIWDRNERFPWRANSPAKAALPTMREIDMYNRYIMATLVSRVALNGVWLIPNEVILPVNPAYEDQQDPFFAELLDIMRAVIKNPGSPASAAPLPLRVPAELIDKFKHLTFATPLDDQIFEARTGAITRLAASLDLPMEVLTGMGATNHWAASQLEESAIKIHISPKIELITRGLTNGYLLPMLKAAGEDVTSNGNPIIIWYDTSQLTQRPDRSDLAIKLSGMGIITDTATRRETGFTESDAPTKKQTAEILERGLVILGGPLAGPALQELTGVELAVPAPPGQQAPVAGGPSQPSGPGQGGTAKPKPPATGSPAPVTTQREAAAPTTNAEAPSRRG